MTSLSENERTHLESLAALAEELAEAARVVLARAQWNVEHPDATPMELAGWSNRATMIGRVLARTIAREPLTETDAEVLENLLRLDSLSRPAR